MNSDNPSEPTGYTAATAAAPTPGAVRAPAVRQWLWVAALVVLVVLVAVTIARLQRSEADQKRQAAQRRRRARESRRFNARGDDEASNARSASSVVSGECHWCGSPLPTANPRRRYCNDACRMRFNHERPGAPFDETNMDQHFTPNTVS